LWPAQPAQKTAHSDPGTTKRTALRPSVQRDEREGRDLWPAQPAQKTARPKAAAARSAAQTDPGTTKRKALGPSASE